MTPLRICLFLLLLWGGSASRPHTDVITPPTAHTALDCLKFGTWGNDWPLCGRVNVTAKDRGSLEQRLAEELKLTVRADGTGEMSFYFCPTQQRISPQVKFTYSLENGRLKFNWLGSKEDVWLLGHAFNQKTSFKATCHQDTLFVDSLLNNTMYRGATYFLRRN